MFQLGTDPLAMTLALPELLVRTVGPVSAEVVLVAGFIAAILLLVVRWSRQDRTR